MIQPMNQTMSMNAMMYPLLQRKNFSDSVAKCIWPRIQKTQV